MKGLIATLFVILCLLVVMMSHVDLLPDRVANNGLHYFLLLMAIVAGLILIAENISDEQHPEH